MILNRWIRLNDDICEECNSKTWIKLIYPTNLPDIAMNTIVTCKCGTMKINESTAEGWCQVDNLKVDDVITMIAEMIE